MKALLLSGGLGTRLRPFTLTTPKPLLPLLNKPFIHYQLALLRKYGINQVVLSIGYRAREFEKIVSEVEREGFQVEIAREKTPLGTGGGIKNGEKFLRHSKEPFLVFNGDILADFNLGEILEFHRKNRAYVTIGLVKVSNPSAYGLVVVDPSGRITRFIEKPKPEEIIADTINAGVYVFQPEVLDEIPAQREVSVERETFPKILESDKPMFGYLHRGYWLDIGNAEKFFKGNFDLLEGKVGVMEIIPSQKVEGDGISVLGEGTRLGEKVVVEGKAIIGGNCRIDTHCILKDAILFDEVVIHQGTEISHSIIGNKVKIGENCTIRNSVLGDGSRIKPFSKLGL